MSRFLDSLDEFPNSWAGLVFVFLVVTMRDLLLSRRQLAVYVCIVFKKISRMKAAKCRSTAACLTDDDGLAWLQCPITASANQSTFSKLDIFFSSQAPQQPQKHLYTRLELAAIHHKPRCHFRWPPARMLTSSLTEPMSLLRAVRDWSLHGFRPKPTTQAKSQRKSYSARKTNCSRLCRRSESK